MGDLIVYHYLVFVNLLSTPEIRKLGVVGLLEPVSSIFCVVIKELHLLTQMTQEKVKDSYLES